ncbi:dihydroxyacetone kinase phosphoryl donor subunit DhaM [Paramaledivibacter caminithermalis]|jgi:dihydroxyacetone kinase phosphotransfer subunit|uniref:phosphoenolpyruvate--glycerone phosphotransferase n=1 Tax=Paramaledivibacter caminithermalis (strain DSM 15212 / CIP 107654 / DViRD3) TaxID=1121301 RepID=A0A1M6RGM9_PARC5|nr:dihydroxyacetone kinase phosphoryl donor subunit DhaM [Paramaledivibacter caminithermalis]SHK31566.1 dihydroxyacetone kinase DhaM subunit [Paramaledivibacter caminithermalis DSM 15212]
MVGIVVVSHSKKIAEGVAELCSQMAHDEQKIEAAGGTEDGRIGTDAIKIMEAIKKADNGEGVAIFVDMGSAIMSTELALDLLDEDIKKRVVIADAPIVEGSIAAVVQASTGSSLEEVIMVAKQSKNIVKI